MISHGWIFLVVSLAWICDGGIIIGSTLSTGNDNSGDDNRKELCNAFNSTRNTLLSTLQSNLMLPNTKCIVGKGCLGVICTGSETRSSYKLSVGINLNCKTVTFWTNESNILGNTPWSVSIPLFKKNRFRQKISLGVGDSSHREIFLKVASEDNFDTSTTAFSLKASLQFCDGENGDAESSCRNVSIVNLPYQRLDVCDSSKIDSRPRSSRSVADPADMHKNQNPADERTSQIGEPCELNRLSFCGHGARCVNQGSADGKGVCQCSPKFVLAKNGTCIFSNHTIDPVDPVNPSENTGSYSATLGVFLSITILFAIAAGAYYGVKYKVFARIRNRLPLSLRCWPCPMMRRNRTDDNSSLAFAVPLE